MAMVHWLRLLFCVSIAGITVLHVVPGSVAQCTSQTRPKTLEASLSSRQYIIYRHTPRRICEWLILADIGQVIRLTVGVDHRDDPSANKCQHPEFQVYDGPSTLNTAVQAFCRDKYGVVYSSNHSIYVRLNTTEDQRNATQMSMFSCQAVLPDSVPQTTSSTVHKWPTWRYDDDSYPTTGKPGEGSGSGLTVQALVGIVIVILCLCAVSVACRRYGRYWWRSTDPTASVSRPPQPRTRPRNPSSSVFTVGQDCGGSSSSSTPPRHSFSSSSSSSRGLCLTSPPQQRTAGTSPTVSQCPYQECSGSYHNGAAGDQYWAVGHFDRLSLPPPPYSSLQVSEDGGVSKENSTSFDQLSLSSSPPPYSEAIKLSHPPS